VNSIPNAAALAQALSDADVLNDYDVSPVRPEATTGGATFWLDDGEAEYKVTVRRHSRADMAGLKDPEVLRAALKRYVDGPCPCECNSGGFCGGCGHAGCGRR
jgi:hypothetical protein